MITSVHNPRVADAAKLRKRGLRDDRGRFLVEGAQAAAEALAADVVESLFHVPGTAGRVSEMVSAAESAGVDVQPVSEGVIAHLTSAVTPQGVVAVARFVDVPVVDLPTGLVPVLCSVRDPGNAGTILRSADAAGASGVVFTRESVDPYNAKSVRASAGSLFHVPVTRDVTAQEAVEALRGDGAQVLAATADGDTDVYDADLARPTALLFGNEAWGLTPDARRLADGSVRVPISGKAESLNLAAAAALILFEAARQRARRPPPPGDLTGIIAASVHDVRLPLTALKGFASTLVDRWDRFQDPARREMVEGMLLDVERVSAMIGLMVDTARIEQGRVGATSQRRDVTETLGWVADVFDRSKDYPDVIVQGSAQAAVDRDRLQGLVLALCDGAMWWGQEGPISIEARPSGGGAVIEVSRGGGGPTEEETVAMFGGPGTDGAKIGLHMARRIVEALGGTLTVHGGEGVRFVLALP